MTPFSYPIACPQCWLLIVFPTQMHFREHVGKPRLVYTGPASNGGSESSYQSAGSGSAQASVIVPFVTTYSPFVNAANTNGGSDQLASLQPSSIKRTYPPASSSPAPATTGGSGIASSTSHEGGEKKIKLDNEEESEK